jgi:hypothetical protein
MRLELDALGTDDDLRRSRHLGLAGVGVELEPLDRDPAAPVLRTSGGGIHEVRHAQEVCDEESHRILVHVAWSAHLLHVARVHDRESVGHRQRLLLVMGDVEERDAHLLLERLQLDLQGLAQLGIEGAERLVEEQHRRVENERASEGDPLLLTARELRRLPLLEAGQLDEFERFRNPPLDLVLGTFRAPDPERDIVEHVQVRKERVVLENRVDVPLVWRRVGDVSAVQLDPSSRRLLEPGNQA